MGFRTTLPPVVKHPVAVELLVYVFVFVCGTPEERVDREVVVEDFGLLRVRAKEEWPPPPREVVVVVRDVVR